MKQFDFKEPVRGRKILLRSSLNVPISSGEVANPYRIEKALPTIQKLSREGARVVVIAHIGREKTDSLKPVYEEMKRRSGVPIRFVDDVVGERARTAMSQMENGDVLMLENLRRHSGETENSETFAETLASFAGLYINDAFAASHRSHASIVGVPKFLPSYAGPGFMEEFEGISPALSPQSPSIAVVGGAKFVTKEPLIRTLLKKYDRVFIGGALAHDFFLAKGFEIGKSLVSKTAQVEDLLQNSKIILPEEVVVQGIDGSETKKIEDVLLSDAIFDIGSKSVYDLKKYFEKAKFILWNGPLGNFEEGFSEGTELLAKEIADANTHTVVGGGDTIASISKLNLDDQFSHVSTAGGAMLHFIAEGTMPGIEALK